MTTTTTTTAAPDTTRTTETVDTYLAMWNEADSARRAELIAAAWAEQCRYVDPLHEAVGHESLGEMIEAVRHTYAGARFRRTTAVDVHHDDVRFGWDLVGADGSVLGDGIDVGRLASDGRLVSITGFFGELEPEEVEA